MEKSQDKIPYQVSIEVKEPEGDHQTQINLRHLPHDIKSALALKIREVVLKRISRTGEQKILKTLNAIPINLQKNDDIHFAWEVNISYDLILDFLEDLRTGRNGFAPTIEEKNN